MKKMLWGLSACALILSSCSQNEVIDNPATSQFINFENLNNRPTRAANENSDDYKVWAFPENTTTGDYTIGGTSFKGIQVNGITNSYGTLVKWPGPAVDFYAIAPFSANIGTVSDVATDFEYTVKAVANEDLTIANPVTGATSGTVALKFHHMLSKIQLGEVKLDSGLGASFVLSSVDGNGIQMRLVTASNKGENNIKALTDWTDVNNQTVDHATSNVPGKPAFDYAAANSHLIMPRQAYATDGVGSVGMYLQLRNVKIIDQADGVGATNLVTNGDLMMYRIPIGSTIDNEFKRGRRYTVNFTLGSDIRMPNPTDPENPDVDGEEVFKNYIKFTATEVNWIDEDMDTNLSNVMLGEPAMEGAQNGTGHKFPQTAINQNSMWDWSSSTFAGLTDAMHEFYLDFADVTFAGNSVVIKLTDSGFVMRTTASSGFASSTTSGVTTYTITEPIKVTITKQ